MADLNNGGNQQVIISDTEDNNVAIKESRLATDSRPAREFGAISAFGIPKFAPEMLLSEFKWTDSLIQIAFIQAVTGSATATTLDPFIVKLTSGTSTSTGAEITTKQPNRPSVTKGIIIRAFVKFNDAGIAGNIRGFGLYNDTDGFFVRLNGTALEFVTRKASVDTVVDASTWDTPVTANTNNNLWYIQYEGSGVGDFIIWYNEQPVHRITNLGAVSTTAMDKLNLPVRLENVNTTNTTDVAIESAGMSISTEGKQSVVINDGQTDISVNSARRMNVQAGFSYLMSQDMDQTLDFLNLWTNTVVGGGSFAQPANTFTLELKVGTGATDSMLIKSRLTNLRQGTGEFSVYEAGMSFRTNNPTNHRKEWGYKDNAELNGVYYRLEGGDFKFVTLKGGVETVTSMTKAKPNANFHNFRIEHLGAGKITGIIINEAGKIIDFSPAAQSLVGSGEKLPFFRSYNTAAPASTPDDMEVHWVRLLDLSGSSQSIRGRDEDNVFRDVNVTKAGNLAVSIEATPPSDINEVEDSIQSGTVDSSRLIPNSERWVIKGLSGGTESSNSGGVISLFVDPLGTGIEANYELITRIYVNGQSGFESLSFDVTGDGTKTVVLQRRQFGGGSFLTTARYAADIL